jgi:hypothetical protein
LPDRSTLRRRQVGLFQLSEDRYEVRHGPLREVQILDADASALAATDLPLSEPDLPEPTGSRDEVPCVRISQDGLLHRDEIEQRKLASPFEPTTILAEPGGLHEPALHVTILPGRTTTG